jgi:hypothetical protein
MTPLSFSRSRSPPNNARVFLSGVALLYFPPSVISLPLISFSFFLSCRISPGSWHPAPSSRTTSAWWMVACPPIHFSIAIRSEAPEIPFDEPKKKKKKKRKEKKRKKRKEKKKRG